jgi:malate dehydrogenase (oxaloacetate-decarboxylating)
MTQSSSTQEVPSAGYSVTLRLRILNKPGQLLKIIEAVAKLQASVAEVELQYSDFHSNVRDVTINCKSDAHATQVIEVVKSLNDIEVLQTRDDTFALHEMGKLEVKAKTHLRTNDELARAYTPGVARVCNKIHAEPDAVYDYTIKAQSVAVVSDGSAVLGLGNIGAKAAIPVMEGKAVLFKQFAGINAFPICLDTQDTEEIIKAVKYIAPVFGGINLEDISAPRCFEIEERLRAELDIPVFHDDQHGTACVVLAGLLNALKLANKKPEDVKVVVNGFGAGGVACTKMLLNAGIKHIIPCDSAGIVYRGRTDRMNKVKEELVAITNPDNLKGSVADALKGADVFIGVSQPGSITREMVKTMASKPIVFALANPIPEILPDEIRDIAFVIATGRSDYANQVNNVLCFPGIFKGAMQVRARDITDAMKVAAAKAIADAVSDNELSTERIIPGVFDLGIVDRVASAVAAAAKL